MINYYEKGSGLHDFLAGQGYSIQQLDGVWIGLPPGNDAVINALIAAYQAPAKPRTIPATEFLLRFPIAKAAQIRASTDPGIQEWMRRADDPRQLTIDLDDPRVAAGMAYLVSKTLLLEAEAAEILA